MGVVVFRSYCSEIVGVKGDFMLGSSRRNKRGCCWFRGYFEGKFDGIWYFLGRKESEKFG